MTDIILSDFREKTKSFLESKGYEDRMNGIVDMWHSKELAYQRGVQKAEQENNCPRDYKIKTLGDRMIIPPIVNGRVRKDWGYEGN